MLHTLYLLRHAKAEPWNAGCNDFERRLSDRGRAHSERLATWMVQHLDDPAQVRCSPSARTRETLAPLLSLHPNLESVTEYVPAIYEASVGDLHALADTVFETDASLLMVGHNPGFEWLLRQLLPPEVERSCGSMSTGALAVIDFAAGWTEAPVATSLRHFVTKHDI